MKSYFNHSVVVVVIVVLSEHAHNINVPVPCCTSGWADIWLSVVETLLQASYILAIKKLIEFEHKILEDRASFLSA